MPEKFLYGLVEDGARKIRVSRDTYWMIRKWCMDEIDMMTDVTGTVRLIVLNKRGRGISIQCTKGTQDIPPGLVIADCVPHRTNSMTRQRHRWFPNYGDDSIHVGDYEECDRCIFIIVMNQ